MANYQLALKYYNILTNCKCWLKLSPAYNLDKNFVNIYFFELGFLPAPVCRWEKGVYRISQMSVIHTGCGLVTVGGMTSKVTIWTGLV